MQSALLYVAGLLTCLWSDLLDSNLLAGEGGTVNAHDVLNVIQRSSVLMGNTNELLSQSRRCNILQCADKTLEMYGKDPAPLFRDTLFGHDFCTQLKGKIDSDTTLSQVVSISKCYHPYADKQRQSTLGRGRQQFFRDGPAGRTGSYHRFFPAKPWHQWRPLQNSHNPQSLPNYPGKSTKS